MHVPACEHDLQLTIKVHLISIKSQPTDSWSTEKDLKHAWCLNCCENCSSCWLIFEADLSIHPDFVVLLAASVSQLLYLLCSWPPCLQYIFQLTHTAKQLFTAVISQTEECLSWLDKNKQINKKNYLTLIFLHSEKAKVPFSPLLDFILVSLLPEGDLYLHISCSTINFCLIQLGQIFCWIVFMQTHLRLYCAARAACL